MNSHDLARILLNYPNQQVVGIEDLLEILKKFNTEDTNKI